MDKKRMEELIAKRTASAVERQVVKSVDLLNPVDSGQERASAGGEKEMAAVRAAAVPSILATKPLSIQESVNDNANSGGKRGRPRSSAEGLIHFSTWLPEGLAWEIRAKAVELHKKDYEVITEALRSYLDKQP